MYAVIFGMTFCNKNVIRINVTNIVAKVNVCKEKVNVLQKRNSLINIACKGKAWRKPRANFDDDVSKQQRTDT